MDLNSEHTFLQMSHRTVLSSQASFILLLKQHLQYQLGKKKLESTGQPSENITLSSLDLKYLPHTISDSLFNSPHRLQWE